MQSTSLTVRLLTPTTDTSLLPNAALGRWIIAGRGDRKSRFMGCTNPTPPRGPPYTTLASVRL